MNMSVFRDIVGTEESLSYMPVSGESLFLILNLMVKSLKTRNESRMRPSTTTMTCHAQFDVRGNLDKDHCKILRFSMSKILSVT